jgi:CheY-like chemotaxis protein
VELLKLSMPRILVLGKGERDLTSIAASVAGLSHFVTSAWDAESLADAVAKSSPEVVVIDLRGGEEVLSWAKDLIATYDQVAEAPRLAVVPSADVSELQSKYLSDFVLYPYETPELAARLGRLLSRGHAVRGGKIISANGEALAAAELARASDVMMKHPIALQLRNLQVLSEIAVEHNSTIVFPAQFLDSARAIAQFVDSESFGHTQLGQRAARADKPAGPRVKELDPAPAPTETA